MYVVFIDMHAGQGMKRNYCTSISFCHSLFKVSRHKACTKEYIYAFTTARSLACGSTCTVARFEKRMNCSATG